MVGRGGAGVVYLATDSTLRRKVALKVLKPELAADRTFRKRFLYESQLAAALDNPHVVPIYAAGEVDDRLYLAMKFVPGSLLALLQRDGALPFDRAVAVVEQVGDALDAAHSLGLVHRDVTPSNVLLEPPLSPGSGDRAYLADFGLAVEHGEANGAFAGKPDYAAPEQIRGEPLDGRADLYSLGCVLLRVSFGQTTLCEHVRNRSYRWSLEPRAAFNRIRATRPIGPRRGVLVCSRKATHGSL